MGEVYIPTYLKDKNELEKGYSTRMKNIEIFPENCNKPPF